MSSVPTKSTILVILNPILYTLALSLLRSEDSIPGNCRKWAWPFRIFCKFEKLCNPTNFVCNRHDEVYQVSELLDLEMHTGLWLATRVYQKGGSNTKKVK